MYANVPTKLHTIAESIICHPKEWLTLPTDALVKIEVELMKDWEKVEGNTRKRVAVSKALAQVRSAITRCASVADTIDRLNAGSATQIIGTPAARLGALAERMEALGLARRDTPGA